MVYKIFKSIGSGKKSCKYLLYNSDHRGFWPRGVRRSAFLWFAYRYFFGKENFENTKFPKNRTNYFLSYFAT